MEDQQDTERLDQAADKIAGVVRSAEIKARDGAQAVEAIGLVVGEYLSSTPAEPHEVELLLDYARQAVVQVSGDPAVADPVLVDYGEEVFNGVRIAPELRAHLGMLLDRLDVAIRLGDAGSVDELVDLCRAGRRTHRHLLCLAEASHRIIDLAHELGQPEALAAAVRPSPEGAARLGHHYWFRSECIASLDALAHLAAEPDSEVGERARAALLDLAGYLDTSGEAAVRLPVHLLTDDDRAKLLAIHESRVDLFSADPMQIPVHHTILRDNRIVRSALWQATDASHI